VHCIGVRGDAWPILLSPCNTHKITYKPALYRRVLIHSSPLLFCNYCVGAKQLPKAMVHGHMHACVRVRIAGLKLLRFL